MKDLKQIQEFFSKPLEENTFKKGDKVTYLGHPAIVTATKEYNGRDFVSVSYDKGTGKTKASMVLTTSGDVKAINEGNDKNITFGDFLDDLDNRFVDILRATKGVINTRATLNQNFTLFRNYISALKKEYSDELGKELTFSIDEEGKPGLWDNIRAKRASGEKMSSKGSKAYKSAVKAGKKINKLSEIELSEPLNEGIDFIKVASYFGMSYEQFYSKSTKVRKEMVELYKKNNPSLKEDVDGDNSPEEKSFDAELMAAANGIAATLGKELKSKQDGKKQLDEAVVTSIITAVLTGNALIGFISKMSKKLAKKFNWKKGEDFSDKVNKWAHDNEIAFQKPIKRILKFFIKDETKLEATTKGIYALIIISMAANYGAEAVSSLSNASWFKAAIASLKGIAKGDEAIVTAYPVLKSFIA